MQFKSSFIALGVLVLSTLLWSGCEEDTIEPTLFGSVFGEVLERDDNVAIPQATVSTNPPTSSVITDAGGRFVLDNIPEGTYSLRAEKNGFLTQVASVTVFGDQDANVIVRMETDSLDNAIPNAPVVIAPLDGATGQAVDVSLSWLALDADEDDVLAYDIVLFNFDMTLSQTLVAGTTDTTFLATDLEYGTNYFWQVIVNDGANLPVIGPVWSFATTPFPDHRFLFARSTNNKYDIFSADSLGNEIQLTENSGNNWRPRMNPQRNKIAFISNQNIEPQIYIMDRDGRNVEKITTLSISGGNQLELDFSWSPDGTKLLYSANSNLYTINIDGTGLTAFSQAPRDFTFVECDWTAQGNFIVSRIVGADYYTSFISTIDAQGNFDRFVVIDATGATGGPKLSIAGTDILYTHDVSGFESQEERQLDARIFTKNLTSGIPVDLSIEKLNGTNDLDPIFSPDGSKVMFTNTNNDGISVKDIYVMEIDGTDRRLLFSNAEMAEWK
ncbi:MAG: carboxypeptidase regulatory-like domain-containing protein [Saprospiraceae bacterium]